MTETKTAELKFSLSKSLIGKIQTNYGCDGESYSLTESPRHLPVNGREILAIQNYRGRNKETLYDNPWVLAPGFILGDSSDSKTFTYKLGSIPKEEEDVVSESVRKEGFKGPIKFKGPINF